MTSLFTTPAAPPSASACLLLALLHSLWQGAAIALLAALLAPLLRTPRARHTLFAAALLLIIFSPIATYAALRARGPAAPPPPPSPVSPIAITPTPAQTPVSERSEDPDRLPLLPGEGRGEGAPGLTGGTTRATLPPPSTLHRPPTQSFLLSHSRPLALAYLTGVALMLLRLTRSLAAAHRLRTTATPLTNSALLTLLTSQSTRLRLKRIPALATSPQVNVPTLLGLLRPLILLPPAIVTHLPPDHLAAIFAHELAHLRRLDPLVHLLQQLTEAALFYHPAVWYLSHRLTTEREHAADDLALRSAATVRGPTCFSGSEDTHPSPLDPSTYAQALLRAAELAHALTAPPLPRSALPALHKPSALRLRILRLLNLPTPELHPPRAAALALIAAALLTTLLLSHTPAPAQQPKPTTQPTTAPSTHPTTYIHVRVIDRARGTPIGNATIEHYAHNTRTAAAPIKGKLTTDTAGRADVPLPPPDYHTNRVELTIRAPNRPMVKVGWFELDLPRDLTVPMDKGLTIGGLVQDDQHHPVSHATVHLSIAAAPENFHSMNDIENGQQRSAAYDDVTTDSNGRWTYDAAPEKWSRIDVTVKHPDFLESQPYYDNHKPTDADYRDLTALTILSPGAAISGTVTDDAGEPLPAATVSLATDRYNRAATTKPSPDGHFTFPHAVPGPSLLLVARAPGRAPVTLSTHAPATDIALKLPPSTPIHARVLDDAGKPVPRASIYAQAVAGQPVEGFLPQVTTGPDGRATLDSPPAGLVVTVSALGYSYTRNLQLTPRTDDADITLTLHRPVVVSGTVTDADTGQPIPSFLITAGEPDFNGRRRPFFSDNGRTFKNGAYAYEFTEPGRGGHYARIDAPGYAPVTSDLFTTPTTFNAQLHRAQNVTGTVLTPDGKPAQNATVLLATETSQVQISDGDVGIDSYNTPRTTADAAGHFSLPPQSEPYALIAIHPTGIAVLPARKSDNNPTSSRGDATPASSPPSTPATQPATLTLQQWAHVDGTLASAPSASQKLNCWADVPTGFGLASNAHFSSNVTTDPQGHFDFPRIPPDAHGAVAKYIQITDTGLSSAGLMHRFHLKPAEHLTFDLGGTGRPVVGRIDASHFSPDRAWTYAGGRLRTTLVHETPPRPKVPDNWSNMTRDEQTAFYKKFGQTPEVKAWFAARDAELETVKDYNFRIAPDGAFRIDDVDPGNYTLTAEAAERSTEYGSGLGQRIATATTQFTVPPLPTPPARAGRLSDHQPTPVDIGTTPLNPLPGPLTGQKAPDFSLQTPDGKTVHLSDYKGKYLLLDFWATWCAPCKEQLPDLKAAYAAAKDNKNFALLGIAVDQDPAELKAFVSQNDIPWPQALTKFDSPTAKAYALHGVPTLLLIGPDGRVVARNLYGARIRATIMEHLSAGK